MTADAADARDKLVYMYVDKSGRPKYVGKGDVGRALSHGGGSASPELDAWVEKHPDHEVRVTDALTDTEALLVESAVISAIGKDALFNISPGERRGRFRPLLIPSLYADRLLQKPLEAADVARKLGGALFVIVNSAPLEQPSVEDLARATESAWMIDRFVQVWNEFPETVPRALVSVRTQGRRFINAAFEIDREAYGDLSTIARDGSSWWVPLTDRTNADYGELRGHRVSVKFGSVKSQHTRWYDASGEMRPY